MSVPQTLLVIAAAAAAPLALAGSSDSPATTPSQGTLAGSPASAQQANGPVQEIGPDLTIGMAMSTVGVTRYVPIQDTQPNSYPDLQSALAASSDCDTIQIAAGVYSGPGNRNLNISNLSIRIVGAGPFLTTIDLEDQGRFAIVADQSSVLEPRVEIEGIRFLDGNASGMTSFGGAGGAIYCYQADLEVQRCIFESNLGATLGGAVAVNNVDSDIEFLNCWFHDNGAEFGGAIAGEREGELQITNCTFADNDSLADGAAIYSEGSISVSSSIIRGNASRLSLGQISVFDTLGSRILYSDVPNAEFLAWSNPPNVGNIRLNPRFVKRSTGDYHLRANSPCRDAGIPVQNPGFMDIDGDFRLMGTALDMGADETPDGL